MYYRVRVVLCEYNYPYIGLNENLGFVNCGLIDFHRLFWYFIKVYIIKPKGYNENFELLLKQHSRYLLINFLKVL